MERTSQTPPQQQIAHLEEEVASLRERLAAAHRQVEHVQQQLATREQHARAQQARLNSLLAVGAALLITHEIETVLDLVVGESSNLFPGTNGALILLHDPETQQLLVRYASQGPVRELSLPIPSQVVRHVFSTPRAMLLPGAELEAIFEKLCIDEHSPLHNIVQPWPPVNVLLAPLRDEDRRMGALLLYCSSAENSYQPGELPFVQALADLAAVAITETYQRARAAALQRDLAQTQFLHREAQARLDTAQAQLLQSAKLAAVGELAASVAHEINNPLYAARNSLYLVEQDLPADAPQQQFMQIAQNELGRIARIITRMRDFYRPSRAELTTTDINSLLQDTVEFVKTYLRHSSIGVVCDLQEDLPLLTAHADQLRQVFLNLVLNACDAMPGGGELRMSTRLMPTGRQKASGYSCAGDRYRYRYTR
ncbi:MAG: GAF domain-containing protein [Blastochloris sp.]|nr:GAF domain-containing protein [Blastochloris sp.]